MEVYVNLCTTFHNIFYSWFSCNKKKWIANYKIFIIVHLFKFETSLYDANIFLIYDIPLVRVTDNHELFKKKMHSLLPNKLTIKCRWQSAYPYNIPGYRIESTRSLGFMNITLCKIRNRSFYINFGHAKIHNLWKTIKIIKWTKK